jgi:hypothetical protein
MKPLLFACTAIPMALMVGTVIALSWLGLVDGKRLAARGRMEPPLGW